MCTLDTKIKRLGLRISHSKVPSSRVPKFRTLFPKTFFRKLFWRLPISAPYINQSSFGIVLDLSFFTLKGFFDKKKYFFNALILETPLLNVGKVRQLLTQVLIYNMNMREDLESSKQNNLLCIDNKYTKRVIK